MLKIVTKYVSFELNSDKHMIPKIEACKNIDGVMKVFIDNNWGISKGILDQMEADMKPKKQDNTKSKKTKKQAKIEAEEAKQAEIEAEEAKQAEIEAEEAKQAEIEAEEAKQAEIEAEGEIE